MKSDPVASAPAPADAPLRRVHLTSPAALSLTFLIIFSAAAIVAKVNYPPEAASMPLIIDRSIFIRSKPN